MMRNEKKGMTAGEIADKICEIAPEALQEKKGESQRERTVKFLLKFQ